MSKTLTMKAAVCRKFGAPLSIEHIHIAPPAYGEIRVAVKASGICYSDIAYIDGEWGGDLPGVFGHEVAGVVESVGPAVSRFVEGDRVCVTLIRYCGQCRLCSRGYHTACTHQFPLANETPLKTCNGDTLTHGLKTGGFAEYVVVDQSQAVQLSDVVSMECGALLSCGVITGFGAVANTAKVEPGASVVVIGAGGVGLNSIQAAAISGANEIIAIDLSDSKLEVAKTFGATHTVNAGVGTHDVRTAVRAATNGRYADYVLVTVGAGAAYDLSWQLLSTTGALVFVGMAKDGVTTQFEPTVLAATSQKVLGCKMGDAHIRNDIPMLSSLYERGQLKLDELVSNTYPLEDINAAIANVKSGEALRNLIVFS